METTGALSISLEASSSARKSLIFQLASSSIATQLDASFSSFTSNDSEISVAVSKSI